MIFIFGFHPVNKRIGPVEEKNCPNCNNSRHWILAKTTDYISFFFLPVIPTKTKRYQFCPVCNYQENLSEDVFSKKEELAKLNQEAVNSNMSDAEYEERLRSL